MGETTATKIFKIVGGLVFAGYVLWHTHKDGYTKGALNTAQIFVERNIKEKEEAAAKQEEEIT